MIKVYIAIGLVIAIFLSGLGIGYKINDSIWLKRQSNVVEKAIENTNQDSEALREARAESEKESLNVQTKIITLPPIIIDNTVECFANNILSDTIKLQHNINASITKVRI